MWRKTLIVVAAIFIAVISVAFYAICKYTNRERDFYEDAFIQLRGGGASFPMTTIDIKAGGSVSVILEHDCCSGAGFDAVAIRASDGQEYTSSRNYCGIEGFYSELSQDATRDMEHFKAFLHDRGYKKQ